MEDDRRTHGADDETPGERSSHFSPEDHYNRSPGEFLPAELCTLTRSIRRASRAVDTVHGFFGLSELPPTRWPTSTPLINPYNNSADLLAFAPYERTLYLSVVARVVTVSLADPSGRPIPHVSLTFAPVYRADLLGILRLLDTFSNLPNELRAERYLPDDRGGSRNSFRPFVSIYDGRNGYILPAVQSNAMARLPPGDILPQDVVVCTLAIQRFWLNQDRDRGRWNVVLRLESVTLLLEREWTTDTEFE
ncbi:hypothetical protein BV25DRAFT_1835450 [Artomyces pyxidatus]|uniref:Uncharacterized protein n=1 Tax=Artomyces pyxidatus TaxID=48021 RepID=A0ACB8TFC8_9AGAM|nr:hypothetical protein BV25DRAFT_1835450 [Artomyces pyxidatus]